MHTGSALSLQQNFWNCDLPENLHGKLMHFSHERMFLYECNCRWIRAGKDWNAKMKDLFVDLRWKQVHFTLFILQSNNYQTSILCYIGNEIIYAPIISTFFKWEVVFVLAALESAQGMCVLILITSKHLKSFSKRLLYWMLPLKYIIYNYSNIS